MTRLTADLMRKAARIASEHQEMMSKLTDAFNDRYGVTYSDVDCDALIDTFDYGQAGNDDNLTLADADRYMAQCGVKPLKGAS